MCACVCVWAYAPWCVLFRLTEGKGTGREDTARDTASGVYPSETEFEESAFSTTQEHQLLSINHIRAGCDRAKKSAGASKTSWNNLQRD